MIRTLCSSLEAKLEVNIGIVPLAIWPWIAKHTRSFSSRFKVGQAGKTTYERFTGKQAGKTTYERFTGK